MKKRNIFYIIILLTIIFYSCDIPSGNRNNKDGYSIVIIDSCEYIEVSSLIGATNGYYSLTHKGNCKFCKNYEKK